MHLGWDHGYYIWHMKCSVSQCGYPYRGWCCYEPYSGALVVVMLLSAPLLLRF